MSNRGDFTSSRAQLTQSKAQKSDAIRTKDRLSQAVHPPRQSSTFVPHDQQALLNDLAPRPVFWKELFHYDELSDTSLISSDGVVFPVNRLVLATASPYFRALFATRLDRDPEPKLEIKSDQLRRLLEFAYTGDCAVNSRSVQILLPIADKYHFKGLIEHCCEFIRTQLEPANCLGIYIFTRPYYCPDFNYELRVYILRNFEEVVKSGTEFLALEFKMLKEFLLDSYLTMSTEQSVYEALCKWTDHSFDVRFTFFRELLSCIRFGLMPYDYFKYVVLGSKYCEASQHVADYLYKCIDRLICPENRESLDEYHILRRPRIPGEYLIAIGGWAALNPMTFVEHYDERADKWMATPIPDITPRAYHGVVFLNGLIFVFGGNDGYDNLSTMYSFDPVTKIWTEKACMHEKRCYVSSACLENKIYAMGGHNAFQRTNTAEMYDPTRNQWTLIAPMHYVRSDASACVLNDKIYIAGGFTGQDVLDTVEFYTPYPANQWTRATPMNSPRCGLSLVTYGHYIYAMGGRMGPTSLQTAERLNMLDCWEPIPPMPITRSNHGVSVLHGAIYVIGGYINGEEGLTNQVDVYHPDSRTWTTRCPLNLNRSGFTACVVKDLQNPETYSYVIRLMKSRGLSHSSDANCPQFTHTACI